MHREIDTFNGDLNARGTMEQPLRVITFCVIFNNLTKILCSQIKISWFIKDHEQVKIE